MSKLQLRSIFISDVHLGTRDAQSAYLLDFLRNTQADYIYLLGDIIDLWKLKSGWHWPRINNDLVQLLLHQASHGTRVVYIPGNHDELLRDYAGMNFNGIDIALDAVHETADGRSLLLLHGDEFDSVVMSNAWLAHIGNVGYDLLLWLNRHFNTLRRRLGFPYWSLSAFLKHKVKNAVNYICSFERAVARVAAERGVDGLVCGHIHRAAIEEIEGVLYANCGDWVESGTAIAEYPDGRLHVIEWVKDGTNLLPQDEGERAKPQREAA